MDDGDLEQAMSSSSRDDAVTNVVERRERRGEERERAAAREDEHPPAYAREYGRSYIRIDTGLLDHDRFMDMDAELQAMWLRLYLVLARNGGFARDLSRLFKWAVRASAGVEHAGGDYTPAQVAGLLDALFDTEWIEEVEGRGFTIRGFTEYQKPLRADPTGSRRAADYRARMKAAREADAEQESRAKEARSRADGGMMSRFRDLVPRPK